LNKFATKNTIIEMQNIYIFILTTIIAIISSVPLQAQTEKKLVKTVVIDAGHGGKDPGAIGKISREKKLTLAIALKLGNLIEKNVPGVNVLYTRKKDEFIDLGSRAEFANNNNADVFISIHINSCKSSRVKGFRTYVNGTARDQENIMLQNQENGDETVDTIVHSLDYVERVNIHNGNHQYSRYLASAIQKQFREHTGRKDLGIEQACFAVLWRTNMTAVLIECGFISNVEEETYISNSNNQEIIASAIYRAFKAYKYLMENGKINGIEKSKEEMNKLITEAEIATKPANINQNNATTKTNDSAPKPNNTTTQVVAKEEKNTNQATTSNNNNNVYFRIQVKSNPTPIPLNSKEFKGLKVEEIKADGKYKYTVGKTQDYNELIKIQNETRKLIKDAFAIATQGDKIFSQVETQKLINEAKRKATQTNK